MDSPFKNSKSWLAVDDNSDFPLQNIPFGIIATDEGEYHAATRIGDFVIDLAWLQEFGFFDNVYDLPEGIFRKQYLNDFINLGKEVTGSTRLRIMEIFSEEEGNAEWTDETLSSISEPNIDRVLLQIPVFIGDYTDFYSSIEHATNVGKMFRDPENALLPNWRHLPVGYHGRASSVVVSGTPLHRPNGQVKDDNSLLPEFCPSRQLDFELEMAFVTGRSTSLGVSIPAAEAEDYIFGMVLFNDMSARDIQKWEYVPLGPFLSKNFGSVISPWIVTLEALEPFRVEGPVQEPEVLPYLQTTGLRNFDIKLEVAIKPADTFETTVCNTNFRYMYWNICQQLAHQTVNGCNINTGDLYASGTISGPDPGSYGSMLELSWKGTKPIVLDDGSERRFLADGDTVIMRGYGYKDGLRIGFGECITNVLPAIQ